MPFKYIVDHDGYHHEPNSSYANEFIFTRVILGMGIGFVIGIIAGVKLFTP